MYLEIFDFVEIVSWGERKKRIFFLDKINPKITIFHFKRHKTIRISGFLPTQLVKPVMKDARKKLYFPEMIV